jgi:hypothetical protein
MAAASVALRDDDRMFFRWLARKGQVRCGGSRRHQTRLASIVLSTTLRRGSSPASTLPIR